MFYYLQSTPPVVRVDFNMTDRDGTIPAARRFVLSSGPVYRGQAVMARDADGNEAEAVVVAVSDQVLRLYLVPSAQADLEFESVPSFHTGQYDSAGEATSSDGVHIDPSADLVGASS